MADQAAIADLLGTGASQRAVVARLGVTRHAVRSVADRLRAEQGGGAASRDGDDGDRRARHLGGVARVSASRARATTDSPWRLTGLRTVVEPGEATLDWKLLDFNAHVLSTYRPWQIVDILTTLSPEVARAVWDYLRLLDPGFEVTAHRPGGDEPFPEAQAQLDAFRARIAERHGSETVLHNRLFLGAISRGGFFAELIMDKAGRVPLNVVAPDPAVVRFRRRDDEVEGDVWEMGQLKGGRFEPYDSPLVRYLPVDPKAGSPYGRSLLVPAIFPAVFLLALMQDLRRVVAQQGYVRPDIAIQTERIAALIDANGLQDWEDTWAEIRSMIDEVSAQYGDLQPDDAFVHADFVTVTSTHGVDASSMRAAGDMLGALDRMTARGLKTMPLLMGMADGASEANANRQWEIHAAGIKSLQHLCESLLEHLYELALKALGIVAKVKVRFAELRSAELMRDEQTLKLRFENAILGETTGYWDRDTASVHATGAPAALPAPLVPYGTADVGDGADPATTQGDGDGGGLRVVPPSTREKVTPTDTALDALPTSVAVDADDLDDAAAVWDDAMDGYAGLLEAEVEGGDEEERA